VASIARYDPSTLPGDDPFPRARMHRANALLSQTDGQTYGH